MCLCVGLCDQAKLRINNQKWRAKKKKNFLQNISSQLFETKCDPNREKEWVGERERARVNEWEENNINKHKRTKLKRKQFLQY